MKALRSREEAEIYIRAGLREARIGGRAALIRKDIDWSDLHQAGKESEIDREMFDAEKSAYWQARYKAFSHEELERIYHTSR